MSRRRPSTPEEIEDATASPEVTRIFLIGILTAVILGFGCGVVWVAYQLLRHYFFQ